MSFASLAYGQGASFDKTIFVNTGRPVAGAKITLCNHHTSPPNPCTDLATICGNVELSGGTIANPTKTDGYGNVLVFLAFGVYDYSVSGNGISTVTYKGLTLNNGTGGTVSSVSGLSPLFTVTNPSGAATFALSNAAANKVFGNCTGSLGAPSYCSITGAMLPNPSASTLGGIESFVASPNQWINAISTSGVPSATQPAFTDISGTLLVNRLTPGSNGNCIVTVAGTPAWTSCVPGASANFAIYTASVTPGCATANPPGSICSNTLTWSGTFADTSYVAMCSGTNVPQGVPGINAVQNLTTTTVDAITTNINQGNVSGQYQKISCVGIHL